MATQVALRPTGQGTGLAAASVIITCVSRVDYPHNSTHVPGMVNVVATTICDGPETAFYMSLFSTATTASWPTAPTHSPCRLLCPGQRGHALRARQLLRQGEHRHRRLPDLRAGDSRDFPYQRDSAHHTC